jgi:predicted Na+-dependent transporter
MAKLLPISKLLIPIVLTLLVGQIFAANIYQLTAHLSMVPVMLLAIFVFFVLTYLLAEGVAKLAGLKYSEHCLLAFTTGARNAPLMLGLTTTVLPDQPLIYATITIGMLIEFPHLTALKTVFLRRLNKDNAMQHCNTSQHT